MPLIQEINNDYDDENSSHEEQTEQQSLLGNPKPSSTSKTKARLKQGLVEGLRNYNAATNSAGITEGVLTTFQGFPSTDQVIYLPTKMAGLGLIGVGLGLHIANARLGEQYSGLRKLNAVFAEMINVANRTTMTFKASKSIYVVALRKFSPAKLMGPDAIYWGMAGASFVFAGLHPLMNYAKNKLPENYKWTRRSLEAMSFSTQLMLFASNMLTPVETILTQIPNSPVEDQGDVIPEVRASILAALVLLALIPTILSRRNQRNATVVQDTINTGCTVSYDISYLTNNNQSHQRFEGRLFAVVATFISATLFFSVLEAFMRPIKNLPQELMGKSSSVSKNASTLYGSVNASEYDDAASLKGITIADEQEQTISNTPK